MVNNKLVMSRIYERLEKEGLDALLALTPENVFYLSDLPTSPVSSNKLLNVVKNSSPSFCVVPKKGEAKLLMTNAGVELAERNSWVKDIRTYATGTYIVRQAGGGRPILAPDATDALAKLLSEFGKGAKIGIDKATAAAGIVQAISAKAKDVNLIDSTRVFEDLRMIKSPEEVRRFKEANRILCAAFRKVIDAADPGVTEAELHFVLRSTMMKEGGEAWQQTTVAVGPDNGPDIYNQPSNRRVGKDEIIRLDVGCVYEGYTADLSRTLVAGNPPPEATKIYNVLQEAEDRLIEACKPGIKASELHRLVVDRVRKGLDKAYARGNVGHGVGVELYDRPFISENDNTPMSEGMTLSLEVPYHKFGLGGFNVEDSVAITKSGIDIASDLPKELIPV